MENQEQKNERANSGADFLTCKPSNFLICAPVCKTARCSKLKPSRAKSLPYSALLGYVEFFGCILRLITSGAAHKNCGLGGLKIAVNRDLSDLSRVAKPRIAFSFPCFLVS
jgi:hypothetical protein